MFKTTITWGQLDPSKQKETIHFKLKEKLGREPTNKELIEECRRIMSEVTVDLASKGKLKHQRK